MIVWSAPVDDLGNWRYRQFKKKSEREKRYIDITGNWLNHPNDYLARILAQVVIKTLGM